ncbi:MAG: hypothetical protein JJE15_13105 [Desulfobacteraceae bacterium]|nr:hypothetical protein [Desulfobacteraceae bacterium]
MMEKAKKKKYEKPEATRIHLDAKTAVLGFCKTTGSMGPLAPSCGVGGGFGPCSSEGS